MTNKKEKKPLSLRTRLIILFLVFSFVIVGILWLFQTVLLKDLYRSLKIMSTGKCADYAAEAIYHTETDDEIISEMNTLSVKYAACMSVYTVTETEGTKTGSLLVDRHVNAMCYVHNLRDSEWLSSIYEATVENGGKLKKWISLSNMFGIGNGKENDTEFSNVVMSRVVTKDDIDYLILVNCEIQPLAATMSTLTLILIVATVAFTVISVILAIISASHISKPIKAMSIEAEKLARGDYNVNFDGGNCKETVNLSQTLNNAADQLSKLDRMQKDLIANVSHDLRTPLTMIQGYTEVMRDIPGEVTPENLQIVIDETKRLNTLVNDMLEVSKNQNGTQTLNPTRFNFTEVIRTTLERYSQLREKDGYTITFEADCDVFVNADENKILQVVYNLINNAVNYTGEDKTVIIRQTVSDGKVTLEVIDTGCGIPEESLPLVWERYYKVHDFHKRANMGTGLGLAIVKSILELHNAEFGVNSTVGSGSTFWFTLPTTD